MTSITIALAGDTMLGRGVGQALEERPPESVVDPGVVEALREADLVLLNLECCISDRGSPWPAPGKPFFFRAPPSAVRTLEHLGASCVTLANNHALDYGEAALLDTLGHLRAADIEWVGAGPDLESACRPAVLEARGIRVRVVGVTDHPEDFAAGPGRPGVAWADLERGVPEWLAESAGGSDGDITVVMPHWGPNMVSEPVPRVRRAAAALVQAGAALVAGHSAHVFHGLEGRVLFDLGDFLDDYAVDPRLRNDLGLLWLVRLDRQGPIDLQAVPIHLEYCFTRLATGRDADWIRRRFEEACRRMGTAVGERDGRLTVSFRPG